jgi:hypothetical protein
MLRTLRLECLCIEGELMCVAACMYHQCHKRPVYKDCIEVRREDTISRCDAPSQRVALVVVDKLGWALA